MTNSTLNSDIVLGIDPSKTCGFAVVDLTDKRVLDFDVCNWQKLPRGTLFKKFLCKVGYYLDTFEDLSAINVEDAHLRGYWAAYYPIVMHGLLDMVQTDFDVVVTKVRSVVWKKQVLGYGNATKDDSIKYVKTQYGFTTKSDDVADAACIATYKGVPNASKRT